MSKCHPYISPPPTASPLLGSSPSSWCSQQAMDMEEWRCQREVKERATEKAVKAMESELEAAQLKVGRQHGEGEGRSSRRGTMGRGMLQCKAEGGL